MKQYIKNIIVVKNRQNWSLATTYDKSSHAVARTCDTDGRWPHSKRPFIWRTGNRKRPIGRPQLRIKDVCKRDLQALSINTDSWEVTATGRDAWR